MPPSGSTAYFTEQSGSGCQQPGANKLNFDDPTRLKVAVKNFWAQATESTPYDNDFKLCSIKMNVVRPSGWTFGIKGIKLKGWVETGSQGSAEMYWKGGLSKEHYGNWMTPLRFEANYSGPFEAVLDVPDTNIDWVMCDALPENVELYSKLTVLHPEGSPGRTMIITTSNSDGDWADINLVWRQCS